MVTVAAVEPADHAAASLQRHLALAVLDRERSLARADAGDSREGERKCEQAEEDKGLPHHGSQYRHAACAEGHVHVRKV